MNSEIENMEKLLMGIGNNASFEEVSCLRRMAVQLCTALYEQEQALEKNPENLKENFQVLLQTIKELLNNSGYSIEDYTGKEFSDDLRQKLKVLSYTKHEKEKDVIFETVSPQIAHDGKIVKTGVVIVASNKTIGWEGN